MFAMPHFRELTKMVGPTNATIRVNPHGYSSKPSRLLASPISTIRIVHFDYSCKPSRLLALVNDTYKKPRSRSSGTSVCDKNYRYKAMLMELSLLDISLSAKRRVFSSSSENCDGLPFTTLPLSLCASHERDFLK